jgi:hypothetical protein
VGVFFARIRYAVLIGSLVDNELFGDKLERHQNNLIGDSMQWFISQLRRTLIAFALTLMPAVALAQPVTVIEYYNQTLDAHFMTGRVGEQTALDSAPGFRRTGMTFQAVAAATAPANLTKICRFYASIPRLGVNTHFYGRAGIDCEAITAANPEGFNAEGFDFAIAQPTGGVCPAGTVAVYRGFRGLTDTKTSNHRYSVSATSYALAITAGYGGEGITFCATSATDIGATPPPSSSTACFSRLSVGDSYQLETNTSSYSIGGVTIPATSRVARNTIIASPTSATFNGRTANLRKH